MISIREIQESDAVALVALCRRLDEETQFMLFEQGERRTEIQEQRARIQSILASDNQILLVAEHEGQLVGFVAAIGGHARRIRHRAHLVIGVLQAFSGQGIGTRLFQEVETWAREKGLHRLELTVMVHNEHAIGLYKKQGFAIEGIKRDSLLVNGAYVDEHYMGKLLT